ncbi:MAG: efflux RND transporter periplasmic adaptor subunit [Desulfobacterales bacterium]|jgi:hypothetical protein|nr:efflux RND transporter periplasmic adaptor subunit [Desulfobacteraceae bacterium]MBT4365519.1 efflux RND transporter periplasmic adaptor subunit [Desulfobacteraceae bacterium]MBT7698117.1 efflux RND transporter periplasmic adaptor subunit [Desulfobacterales bacterium]
MTIPGKKRKIFFSFRTILIITFFTISAAGWALYISGFPGPYESNSSVAEDNRTHKEKHDSNELWTCGMHPFIILEEPGDCPVCGMNLIPKRDEPSPILKNGERKIAYWRAPMNPSEIYNEPGKSAMGMDLVPVFENEVSGGIEIRIDPVTRQNMGIRTANVEKGPLNLTIRTYGHITYDETKTAQISPKFSGWIEKLFMDFTGQMVEKGNPMFTIFSPELITAQEEYLAAYRSKHKYSGGKGEKMLASARRRLNYYDITDPEIRTIETSGAAIKALKIRSPFKGVVTRKNAVKGGYVKTGTTVYEIADLSRVWVEAHIYEYELSLVKAGMEVEMTLPYQPGKVYKGKVAYVYPYLQKKTRDVVVRLEFENPELELKPGMYTDVLINTTPGGDGLIIPSESVIRSGKRNIVFVPREGGKFTPREVNLGFSLDGGMVQILTGLAPGESVVTSGQFLLDSESKLKEVVQKMLEVKKDKKEKVKDTESEFLKDPNQMDQMDQDDEFFNDMENEKV